MNYCVNGLGFMVECGKPSTTRREGWPLCDEHAKVWDGFKVMAASLPEGSEPDFVAYARAVV